MASALAAVVFEAADVPALAGFWAAALGEGWQSGDDGTVRRVGRGRVALAFVASTRAKTGKNRLHLDLSGGIDQAGTVERLLALGARRVDIGQGEVPWDVLADPEGNEFCVLPGAAADGGLAQICQDAAEPAAQGRFWAAATGWTVTEQGTWGVRLQPAPGAAPSLVMGPPVASRSGANRVRFALAAEDVGQAEAALVAAGAVRTSAAGVLADPEGNEFALTASGR